MKDENKMSGSLFERALERLKNLDIPDGFDLQSALESAESLKIHQEELRIQNEDLKAGQKELARVKSLYFQCFDLSPIPTFQVNREGLVQQCNLKAAEVFKIARQDLNTKESRAILASLKGHDFKCFRNSIERTIESSSPAEATVEMTIHEETYYFQLDIMPVTESSPGDTDSEYQAFIFFTDLTDYRVRELELRKLTAALEQNPAAVFITAPDGTFQYVNPAFERIYGYKWEDVKGKTPRILKSGLRDKNYYKSMWSHLLQGSTWKDNIINKTSDGRNVMLRVTVFPVQQHHGKLASFIAIQEDITESVESQKQLELYSGFVESVDFSVIFTNPQREVTWSNPAFERLTGYTFAEIRGKNLKNVLQGPETDPAVTEKIHQAVTSGKSFDGELINYSKSGEKYWVRLQIEPIYDLHGNLNHFVSIQNDVSDRRRLEDQYYRKQRLESIGSLAGGMAHDINNLLQPISLGIDLVRSSTDGSDKDQNEILDMMQESASKAAGIISQVLTFARGGETGEEIVDILPVVKLTRQLIRETVSRQIEIRLNIEQGPFFVQIASTQLTQILMNLVINSRDAIQDKGTIDIGITQQCPDYPKTALIMGDPPKNEAVWLEVSDDGDGISHKNQALIFEPFYTTKTLDKGTGMGLATVYGIIQHIGGCLILHSDGASGTTFLIGFPLTNPPVVEEVKVLKKKTPGLKQQESKPNVVIVDDEAPIARSLAAVFTRQEYHVEVFSDPQKALDWIKNSGTNVDLLLTDQMMPGMSGTELARSVRASKPETCIVIMTGLHNAEAKEAFEAADINGVLQKPFEIKKLLEMVSQLI